MNRERLRLSFWPTQALQRPLAHKQDGSTAQFPETGDYPLSAASSGAGDPQYNRATNQGAFLKVGHGENVHEQLLLKSFQYIVKTN